MDFDTVLGLASLIASAISFLLYQRFSVATRITSKGRMI